MKSRDCITVTISPNLEDNTGHGAEEDRHLHRENYDINKNLENTNTQNDKSYRDEHLDEFSTKDDNFESKQGSHSGGENDSLSASKHGEKYKVQRSDFKSKSYKRHGKRSHTRPPKPKLFSRSSTSLERREKHIKKHKAVSEERRQFVLSSTHPEVETDNVKDEPIPTTSRMDNAQITESLLEFDWMTKEFSFTDVIAPLDPIPPSPRDEIIYDESLSQQPEPVLEIHDIGEMSNSCDHELSAEGCKSALRNERKSIEEEIHRKCVELDALMGQIQAVKRQRRRRNRKYELRKNDGRTYADGDPFVPSFVNIYPIERRKRPAKPIRNALLIRAAMKAAWSGVLSSCCGRGCWATWSWVNIHNVLSDYE
ncbi:uncharacterized protein LOC127868450 [Dreissena polymorpha]|uniref:Uncharacterized protein n=1 Tax=Dreissena polymorpha TaxID=45954 RepID=A0A9D4RJS9_DREPO|nr:uncharacterized protein LOC127868450 [Dreissena polymorpha]KAH3871261.1 hypothetical protein DPMN_034456 [Dreissena polymorpha]